LAAAIADRLAKQVPEVTAAISQPIQNRTSELVAGVRSDAAAQLYGPDLDELRRRGETIAAALKGVPGVVDVRAEQTSGLTHLRIRPDRSRLARYGLTIE